MASSPYHITKPCVFRATFNSEQEVRDAKGTIQSFTFTSRKATSLASNSYIVFNLRNSGVFSIRVKVSNLSQTDTRIFSLVSGGSNTCNVYGTNGSNVLNTSTGIMYINGVAGNTVISGVNEIVISGITIAATAPITSFIIGNLLALNYSMIGATFELAEIYKGALTAQDVSNLYNDSYRKDVSINSKEQLGPELVVNGGFDTDTDWTKESDWSISGGKANYADTAVRYISPIVAVPLTAGKRYKITFDISNLSTGSAYLLFANTSGTGFLDYSSYLILSNGSYSYKALAVTSITNFRVYGSNASGSTWSLDNLSIKEILVEETNEILNVSNCFNKYSSITNTVVTLKKNGERNVMSFNGTTSKLDCGNYDTLVGHKSFIAWVKPYSFGENSLGNIINNSKVVFGIYIVNARVYFNSDGSTNMYSANNSITLNKWNFVVVNRTSVGITNIYINGVLSGIANQSSGTPSAGTTNITIGNNSAGSLTQYGLIDNVRVVNGILTPAQIAQLYSSERKFYNV
jgi:hypothetical protein